MVCVPKRQCDDADPVIDRVNCRGVREACTNGLCECGGDSNFDGTNDVPGSGLTTTLRVCNSSGVKTFAGYYDDHKRGEIITAEREKVFVAFGGDFVRIDAGEGPLLIKRRQDSPIFFVNRAGKEIARGKVAANSCFLDTHDAALVKLAPEVLILLAFHDLPAPAT